MIHENPFVFALRNTCLPRRTYVTKSDGDIYGCNGLCVLSDVSSRELRKSWGEPVCNEEIRDRCIKTQLGICGERAVQVLLYFERIERTNELNKNKTGVKNE